MVQFVQKSLILYPLVALLFCLYENYQMIFKL